MIHKTKLTAFTSIIWPFQSTSPMCSGVYFTFKGESYRIYFSDPNATLPVLRKDGNIDFLPWGRRKEEPGILPLGGWASLEAIKDGKWDEWFPRPAKLSVNSFMEKNLEDVTGWYDVTKGKFIQGVIAREKDEIRVYVVTIVPKRNDADHARWPRIISD